MQTYYTDRSGNLSLELPYGNRSFAVHFALADYTRPGNNKYSYILEGHDKEWINLGNQSFIRMVDVPPGKYKLRIKALGSDGMWNEKELNISIIAAQIFYRSWWFIGLGILLVSGSAFAFYTYRIRQYRKMLDMRTRIASDLHDEVGSHLTGIALSSDLMKQFPADERIAKLIERISNSSRQASTKMSDVLWSIDSRSDTLDSLLNRITEHALEIFEPAGIEFTIKTEGLPEHQKLPMNTRHNLYLIFKEATNNIVKHSGANKATISVAAKNGWLEMRISDNGTAPPDPDRKTGQGLRNMHMRAELMNGKIEINFENGFRIQVAVKI
jgi:signal transduction histidine kinase